MIKRMLPRFGWVLMICTVLRMLGSDTHADEASLQAEIDAKISAFYSMRNAEFLLLEEQKTERSIDEIFQKVNATEDKLCRELVNLSTGTPMSQAAKKAMIWVMNKPVRSETGDYGVEFYRAAYLLVRYHGNDAEVASLGLWMDKQYGAGRDLFIYGMNLAAKDHEAKGLARFSLALYLNAKSKGFQHLQNQFELSEKATVKKQGNSDFSRDPAVPNATSAAYHASFRNLDTKALAEQAKTLFEEVARDYPDVPAKSSNYREMEESMRLTPPMRKGRLMEPDEVEECRKLLAKPVATLSEVAKSHLAELETIVEGKLAPEIDAEGMDGKRFKLSDYHGKIVVLIFWGTWCAPCMSEVPHERIMAEKYKGKPVALLGVDCDEDRSKGLEAIKKEGISWPNWFDGAPGEGPITKAYHVRGFPTMMVIDAQGVIRSKIGNVRTVQNLVDSLLVEMNQKNMTK